jgi:hypothetical protein
MSLRPFFSRARNAVNHAFGRQPMRRLPTALPGDVWLTSYPKSGNTWTRFLIANLVAQGTIPDFTSIERLVPDVYANTDVELQRVSRPRFIKSHEPYRPEYRRVLLIVRDPRDVAISYFHFARKMGQVAFNEDIEAFVPRFVSGVLDDYGSWGENVGSWLGARRGTNDFVLVRYEDLLTDADKELSRIALTFGISADSARIRAAVANSNAERLRDLEATQGHKHRVLKRTRSDIPFIRKASAGQWQAELPVAGASLIEKTWGHVMRELGY